MPRYVSYDSSASFAQPWLIRTMRPIPGCVRSSSTMSVASNGELSSPHRLKPRT